MFEELPANEKARFESRMKARKAGVFESVLFEMQLYRILRKLNFSVEIEVDFPGTEQRIDFLAHSLECEDQSVYVEATVCGFGKGKLYGNSNEDDAAKKIRKNIPSPHSHIWLEAEGTLRQRLEEERVVKPFRELLEKHSPEEVRRIHSRWGLAQAGRFLSTEIREGDWVLKGTLDPLLNKSSAGQVWGAARSGVVDGSTPLSKAARKKAKKWKESNFRGIPFLIAVNVCHSEFDGHEDDINRALFEYSDSGGRTENFEKSLSHVSGVMVFNHAVLGNEISARVRLFRNGDANIPDRFHFLLEEQKLGDLLGIESS